MADLEGLNGVSVGSIEAVNGVAKSSIQAINAVTPAAPVATFRVAMAVGESAHILYSAESDLTDADNWTLLDLGSGGFDDIAWGYDDSDNEVWILTKDAAAIPMKIAVSDGSDNWIPSASANWADVRPDGSNQLVGAGHRISFCDTGSNDRPTWAMTSISNEEYAYYITGSITDTSAWQVQYRGWSTPAGNDDTGRQPPLWNRSASAAESVFIMGWNRVGTIFSSVNGTGSEDSGDWTLRYNPGGSSAVYNKSNGGYGAGVWVVMANQTSEDHVTGSSDGVTWGALNAPTAGRPMISCATDMAGAWMACGNNGYVWKSTDNAVTWAETRYTSSASGVYKDMKDIAYDNDGTWLIVGTRDFWVSVDGSNWTALDPEGTANRTYNAVAFNVVNSSQ